jgi:hypothetical protein
VKSLKNIIPLIVAFFATYVVEGATFERFGGFGSVTNAEQWAATCVNGLTVRVFQNPVNGGNQIDVSRQVTVTNTYASKAELDDRFYQLLDSIGAGALTNTMVDKRRSFRLAASGSSASFNFGIVDYFFSAVDFYLTKNPDGTYSLPDFRKIVSLQLYQYLMYEFDDTIEFGRIEVYDNPNYYPFDDPRLFWETDTRLDPQDDFYTAIIPEVNAIQIKTSWITAGTNSPTLIKIMLCLREGDNHVYKVFGPMGDRIPETPLAMTSGVCTNGNASIIVGGGDPGRVVQLQQKTDLDSPWADVGGTKVVPRYGGTINLQAGTLYPSGFFRIRTANVAPYLPSGN